MLQAILFNNNSSLINLIGEPMEFNTQRNIPMTKYVVTGRGLLPLLDQHIPWYHRLSHSLRRELCKLLSVT